MTASLAGCAESPAATYDVALLDLDGVVYLGADPVPHAVEALAEARTAGMRAAYLTNNASRTPQDVSAQLTGLGVRASPDDIVTSAQAAASLLADRLAPGDPVLVTGAAALRDAVTAAGLHVVASADDQPRAVVMGYDPTLDYARLSEAALAVRRGAMFIASNLDATLPTPRGLLPGMGSLAALVSTGSGRLPDVAGKPERPLFDMSVERSGAQRPLTVGDRLDTDIEGARRAGLPAMLVMTGVTNLEAVAVALPGARPSLIAADLRGLNRPHPKAEAGRCGQALAEYVVESRRVVVRTRGDDTRDETLAAVVTAAWQATDAGHHVERVDPI